MFYSSIGENIREVRLEKKLSQETLADRCGFSNTTLSSYENGRRDPSLDTIAKIAHALGVTIDRLYYGDENEAFITSETDEGRKVVNAVYYLWEIDAMGYYENFSLRTSNSFYASGNDQPRGMFLLLQKYSTPIKRLITSLDEFREKKETYSDPEQFLEYLLSSVANEIDKEIESNKVREKKTKHQG